MYLGTFQMILTMIITHLPKGEHETDALPLTMKHTQVLTN